MALKDAFPLFPRPDEIVRSYLVTGERVIHIDQPALNAFVIIQWREVLLALGLLALFVWSLSNGGGALSLLAFIALDLLNKLATFVQSLFSKSST